MSMEQCKLCEQEGTPWYFINGHICENCYYKINPTVEQLIKIYQPKPECNHHGDIPYGIFILIFMAIMIGGILLEELIKRLL